MEIDKTAAGVERAATEHARAVVARRMVNKRLGDVRSAVAPLILRPSELAGIVEAAFIAGSCHARRVGVIELDETLRATMQGGPHG